TAPVAPSEEWRAIENRIRQPHWLSFPGVRLLVPATMAAALMVVLWTGRPSPPNEVPVETYLVETMESLYQGEIDEAIGEWAYLVNP
ncbi:MAG: hypothetical protein KDD39_15850, partial [Bdellovibrionales bacterium]|nr:hypothetical protein [Bdellovibrionales bacterium]